jgi:hypothetical protein
VAKGKFTFRDMRDMLAEVAKLGDVGKWLRAGAAQYVGVDISRASLEHGVARLCGARGPRGGAREGDVSWSLPPGWAEGVAGCVAAATSAASDQQYSGAGNVHALPGCTCGWCACAKEVCAAKGARERVVPLPAG